MKSWKVIFVLIVALTFCGVVSAGVISDLGNGVYFFDGYPDMFGHDLSRFLTDHSYLRVVSIAAFDNGAYGSTSGYYVVFENKSVMKMNCEPNKVLGGFGTTVFNYTCMAG